MTSSPEGRQEAAVALNATGLKAAHRVMFERVAYGDEISPRDMEAAIRAYLSAPVAAVAPAVGEDETAWLIELRGNVPKWWSLEYRPGPNWTQDANRALRFARKEDADAYIWDIGWTEAFATEHMWPTPRPLPALIAPAKPASALEPMAGFLVFLKDMRFTGSWDVPTLNRAIEVGETIVSQSFIAPAKPAMEVVEATGIPFDLIEKVENRIAYRIALGSTPRAIAEDVLQIAALQASATPDAQTEVEK